LAVFADLLDGVLHVPGLQASERPHQNHRPPLGLGVELATHRFDHADGVALRGREDSDLAGLVLFLGCGVSAGDPHPCATEREQEAENADHASSPVWSSSHVPLHLDQSLLTVTTSDCGRSSGSVSKVLLALYSLASALPLATTTTMRYSSRAPTSS